MAATGFVQALVRRDQDSTINCANTFLRHVSGLQNRFNCSFELSDDFGGKQAAFLDIFPVAPDLAVDHKKFGGIFVRIWVFGEPKIVVYGIFLGAERAEQKEPRRGVALTRKNLGQELAEFESVHGFSYHTWSTGNFPWASKSSRAVARQLEQFVSFRQDDAGSNLETMIENKVGNALHFLDCNLSRLKPIAKFGMAVIREYYSENLPAETMDPASSLGLSSLIGELKRSLDHDEVGVLTTREMLQRFVACLLSKRFVIASGLAGSGKTQLAQAFARWITPTENTVKAYEVTPVGADWTGNENILGYPNGLDGANYVSRPALELIRHAIVHDQVPHFLLLDEMNLSHVERYFADLLSAIESGEEIPLYDGTQRNSGGQDIPRKIRLPENLFIIGTVNIDETTYMFSPKVLDRANVIEFRMDKAALKRFLKNPTKPDMKPLGGKGAGFGAMFVAAAKGPAEVPTEVKEVYEAEMMLFFSVLCEHGAEFGYRVAHEVARFIRFYKELGDYPDGSAEWFPGAFDCVVFQKLLPKLHGSRSKLGPLLKKLWFLCTHPPANRSDDPVKKVAESARTSEKKTEPSTEIPDGTPYPLSADKIGRMWRLLNENGFASFAEA